MLCCCWYWWHCVYLIVGTIGKMEIGECAAICGSLAAHHHIMEKEMIRWIA